MRKPMTESEVEAAWRAELARIGKKHEAKRIIEVRLGP
jgi:hypothetical protein